MKVFCQPESEQMNATGHLDHKVLLLLFFFLFLSLCHCYAILILVCFVFFDYVGQGGCCWFGLFCEGALQCYHLMSILLLTLHSCTVPELVTMFHRWKR